jgi:hypothetical protein
LLARIRGGTIGFERHVDDENAHHQPDEGDDVFGEQRPLLNQFLRAFSI